MALPFPSHEINPALKTEAWHLQAAKAAWDEYKNSGIKIGYNNRDEYRETDDYILANQSNSKYKKAAAVDDTTDSSWAYADWTARPISAKLRDIGISKIVQRMYNITATPIDLMAKDETETYYAEHKAKIQMRDAALQQNPELAKLPIFQKQHGEPADMEELEMMMELGIKLKVAMEAEMGIDYVFFNNKFKDQRKANIERWWDYGVAGYKEYVDENSEVRHRDVNTSNFVVSYCHRPDFSDARFIGEVDMLSVGELPFPSEKRKDIAERVNRSGSWYDNGNKFGEPWDKEKVPVLDIEFLTYNDRIYEQRENKNGNKVFRRASWDKKGKSSTTVIEGKEVQKYINKPVMMIYKCKWIIDTDYIFDFGPATYQKREMPNKALTTYSYHMYAPGMKNMKVKPMQRRLIPIIDEYHNTIFKIQNFKNKWIPYVINIDLQAMENVALGANGALKPAEILDLLTNQFVALGRRMDANTGMGQNYKMVDIEPTGMGQEYSLLVGDLSRLLGDMRDVTGLNDLTDGSTPGERTLNYVASLGAEATNNALYPLTWADKSTAENLAKGVILRLVQTILNKGNIEGVIRTLGDETVKFISVTKDIAKRMWDIKIEDRPTDAEKQMLMQELGIKENQGLIGPDDQIMISQTTNLKQARVLLSHRIKQRRKEMEESKLRDIRANGEVQQQSAIVAEESKQKTIQLQYDLQLRNELAILEKKKEIEAMKLRSKEDDTDKNIGSKVLQQQMATEAAASPAPVM